MIVVVEIKEVWDQILGLNNSDIGHMTFSHNLSLLMLALHLTCLYKLPATKVLKCIGLIKVLITPSHDIQIT